MAKHLEAGLVGINEGKVACPEGTYGGIKESGVGREGSKFGVEEYTEVKYVNFGNV